MMRIHDDCESLSELTTLLSSLSSSISSCFTQIVENETSFFKSSPSSLDSLLVVPLSLSLVESSVLLLSSTLRLCNALASFLLFLFNCLSSLGYAF